MVGDNMKKRKRKINKKRILILILFLLIILSIGIYLIVPKRYGYQKDVINVFKEDNYYEKIKEKYPEQAAVIEKEMAEIVDGISMLRTGRTSIDEIVIKRMMNILMNI